MSDLQAFLALLAPLLWIGGAIALGLILTAVLLGMVARIWR